MNFTYENQGTNTYLVYRMEEEDVLDSMSLGMITNNKIPGLAPSFFMQMDMSKYIKYNVSAKISVSQFFAGSVNQKRLIGVFSGIVDAMLSAEDYMIDANSILMDLDYIFADVSTCETNLICLPLINTSNQNVNLGAFFKNIMFCTRFDQTENCDYVAKIINYLNSTPVFSLMDFKALLEKIKGAATETVQVHAVQNQSTVISQGAASQASVQPVSQPVVQQVQPTVTPQPIAQQPVVKPQQAISPVQPSVANATPVQQKVEQRAKFSGFAVPSETKVQDESKEKKKGMFGFLSSSGKEDKDLKKKQKEEEKLQKEAEKQQAKASKKDKKKSDTPQGFAVPGQAPAFAIPGQQPSVQQTPVQATSAQFNVPSGQSQQPSVQRPVQQGGQQNIQPSAAVAGGFQAAVAPQGHAMNFGETTVLGGGGIGETTVLNASMLNQQQTIAPHIIRAKNNEKIMVNKPVFRIGKERSYVDYFIGDNSGISRSHANIITREGKYYVVDTNSTNHTFVNGTIIQSNVEVEITHGDKLRFANEDFEFKVY